MLLQLIEDIEKALNHDCYLSALGLALTLPDICGKAKYPEEKNSVRYKKWYDEYVGEFEKRPFDNTLPYLSGEVIYSLRCSFVHEGNPNISKKKLNSKCQVEQFVLIREKKNKYDLYGDTAHLSWFTDGTKEGKTKCVYKVNIRRLCLILCANAKGYYEENKEQFNFFNYMIEDYDPERIGMSDRTERKDNG